MINCNISKYMMFLTTLTVLVHNKNQEYRAKLMDKCAELLNTEKLGPDVVHLTILSAMADEQILKIKPLV